MVFLTMATIILVVGVLSESVELYVIGGLMISVSIISWVIIMIIEIQNS